MKRLIFTIAIIFCAVPLFAGQWCMWDETESEGVFCQSDTRGYVRMPDGHPISIIPMPDNLNYHGFYELITTDPVLGENQVRDQVVWGFSDNTITRTWTVRDLTQEEIDQRTSSPMPLSEYYLWKALIVKGVITQQEAASALPQELIDAYLARDRLANP